MLSFDKTMIYDALEMRTDALNTNETFILKQQHLGIFNKCRM